MHLCQEGNEKLFRLHIRRTDKFAGLTSALMVKVWVSLWHSASDGKPETLDVANLAPNKNADQRWWDDPSTSCRKRAIIRESRTGAQPPKHKC